MKTNSFFALFLVVVIYSIHLSAAEPPKYFKHSLVSQLITPEKQKAIDLWISFLYEADEGKRKVMWDSEEVARFGDGYCMFNSLFATFGRETTLEYFKPYILKVEEQKDAFLITTIFTQFDFTPRGDSAYYNQNPISIVKIAVTRHSHDYKIKNVLDIETQYWKRAVYGNINYIVEPSVEIDNKECEAAVRFVDSLSMLWHGKKYDKRIDYYVTNSMESIQKIAGFEFAFVGGFTGMANPEAHTLFADTTIFNYRHELSHLVFNFPSDSVNGALSEGMATYFGGTRNSSFEEAKKEFSAKYFPIKNTDLDKIFAWPGHRDFYAFSALVIEQVVKSKGIEGLKKLTSIPGGEKANYGIKELLLATESLLGVDEAELIAKINESMSAARNDGSKKGRTHDRSPQK